ncbi:unnamed protein product [Cylindrotheca closterium]|uniref:Uncharacterized protein n=1 Tax=Cylindrotheca closterium TaxID=2856 RepID=A0AAD2CTQ9_9STRA|nr:unnamed protein product [Cylindrotheca closterium]
MDPITALHAAILQTVRKIPSTDDYYANDNDDDDAPPHADDVDNDNSSTSSVSFNDTHPIPIDARTGLPSIVADALTRPPTISTPTISTAMSADSSFLPPMGGISRRDSLEVRYHLEDEAKNQLTQFNQTLRQQMLAIQQENERLQRQMAIQNKEHRFAKAQWNDRFLDLQVELDATKLEHLRIQEAKEDAILQLELEDLKNQMVLNGDYDDDEGTSSHAGDDYEEEETKQQQTPTAIAHNSAVDAITVQSQHFAIIPPRQNGDLKLVDTTGAASNQALQQQQQQQQQAILLQNLKSEQSIWKQEKQEWELEKSQLRTLLRKMTDQVEDSRIRVEWLERELIAICPSDTDSDNDKDNEEEENNSGGSKVVKEPRDGVGNKGVNGSDISAASTKKSGKPVEAIQQISQGSAESSARVTIQSRSSSGLGDDPPEQLLERRLQQALESYVQIQGHQNRKIKKLTKQLHSLEKEKEMDEGMQYQQMAEMKQQISYYKHELQQHKKTLQFQVHSRDEFHDEWTRRIETLELENLDLKQQAIKWEKQCMHQTGLLKREVASLQDKLDQGSKRIEELEQELAEKLKIEKTMHYVVTESMSSRDPVAEVDAIITLQLAQSKEREAMLEKQLKDRNEKLKTQEEELDRSRERIEVLMAYAGMDASNDDGEEGEL